MKRSDTSFFKKATSPILPNPPYLWEEKSEAPPPPTPPPLHPLTFFENFENSILPYKVGGGFQLCFSFFKLRKYRSLIEKLMLPFLYKKHIILLA